MRQIVLDTETTGLDPLSGHRIIEIGCVELRNRRLTGNNLHLYINPERDIDEGALEVHGITREFLADKPTFEQIAEEFMTFVDGAELVIHNAPFDVGFLDHELRRLGGKWGAVAERCRILDTLKMARDLHPGQKNSLDALCRRYDVENAHRELHGALRQEGLRSKPICLSACRQHDRRQPREVPAPCRKPLGTRTFSCELLHQ